MTDKQLKLAAEHGTPAEFKAAVLKAANGCEITTKEAIDGIEKYQKEWDAAGVESRDALIVLNAQNDARFVFLTNEDRDTGLNNAGIDPAMFKRLGFRTVIGKVTFAL